MRQKRWPATFWFTLGICESFLFVFGYTFTYLFPLASIREFFPFMVILTAGIVGQIAWLVLIFHAFTLPPNAPPVSEEPRTLPAPAEDDNPYRSPQAPLFDEDTEDPPPE